MQIEWEVIPGNKYNVPSQLMGKIDVGLNTFKVYVSLRPEKNINSENVLEFTEYISALLRMKIGVRLTELRCEEEDLENARNYLYVYDAKSRYGLA